MTELPAVFRPHEVERVMEPADQVTTWITALSIPETKKGDHFQNKAISTLISRVFQAGFTVERHFQGERTVSDPNGLQQTVQHTEDLLKSCVVLRGSDQLWRVELTKLYWSEGENPTDAEISLKIESGNASACFPIDPVIMAYRGKRWTASGGYYDSGNIGADSTEEFGYGERFSHDFTARELNKLLKVLMAAPVDDEATKEYLELHHRTHPGASISWNGKELASNRHLLPEQE